MMSFGKWVFEMQTWIVRVVSKMTPTGQQSYVSRLCREQKRTVRKIGRQNRGKNHTNNNPHFALIVSISSWHCYYLLFTLKESHVKHML